MIGWLRRGKGGDAARFAGVADRGRGRAQIDAAGVPATASS